MKEIFMMESFGIQINICFSISILAQMDRDKI